MEARGQRKQNQVLQEDHHTVTELVPAPARLERAPTVFNYMEDFLGFGIPNTSIRYRNEARQSISKFIIYCSKTGITPRAINDYPTHVINSGRSHGTAIRYCATIKQFLRWCFKMGYTRERYYEYFPTLRTSPPREPEIIRHDEYLKLIESCGKFKDKAWIITLGYNTGFRLGDCCNLRWSNVDMREQLISIVLRKTASRTGAMARIPYQSGGDLYRMLQERLSMRESENYVGTDYVCPLMACRYNSNKCSVSMIIKDVFIRAGLSHKKFKDFRSTFESRLANSGMNLSLASRITGRSDMRTLMRYVRMDLDAAREGVAKALELHNVYPSFK